MGSHMNFNGFGDAPLGGNNGGGGKPIVNNNMLARQSSVYSLTFDEFQNTIGGYGKDFGSMNMDELLKNIWTAEETQILASGVGMGAEGGGSGGGGVNTNGNIQRQGSLTLPRTLSQMTVDEVWRDLFKDSDNGAKVGSSNGTSGETMPHRQPTLGEMTLEEFLVRAGIVREDAQEIGRPSITNGSNNNTNALAFEFQQPSQNSGLVDNRVATMTNPTTNRPLNLPMNNGGVRSSQQVQMQQQQQQQQLKPQQQQQQPQPLYPKPATLAFAPPMHLVSNAQLTSPATRETIVGVGEPVVSSALVQARGLQQGRGGISSMANVGAANGVTVGTRSPANHISSNVVAKANAADSPSVSPVPYMFSRGGKCGPGLEKVIERRHRRMIKNRESAARSRARKQAYTLELEAEIAKLKEVNEELVKKQEEFLEMQKVQILEAMNGWGSKRQCLRRTLTGPW